jgi:hypothetical protein
LMAAAGGPTYLAFSTDYPDAGEAIL